MSEGRDIYHEPKQKVLLRTADVYQTEVDDEVAGYSDKLLAIVADYHNGGRPEGMNAQAMVGKSKRGEVAFRLFGRINPETRVIEAAGFKTRGCLAMTGCASATCSMIEGRTFDEALALTIEDVREAVGGVPAGKANTLTFSVEAVRLPCAGGGRSGRAGRGGALRLLHRRLSDVRALLAARHAHRPARGGHGR